MVPTAQEVIKEIEAFEGLEALRLEGNTVGVEAAKVIAKALEKKSELKVRRVCPPACGHPLPSLAPPRTSLLAYVFTSCSTSCSWGSGLGGRGEAPVLNPKISRCAYPFCE